MWPTMLLNGHQKLGGSMASTECPAAESGALGRWSTLQSMADGQVRADTALVALWLLHLWSATSLTTCCCRCHHRMLCVGAGIMCPMVHTAAACPMSHGWVRVQASTLCSTLRAAAACPTLELEPALHTVLHARTTAAAATTTMSSVPELQPWHETYGDSSNSSSGTGHIAHGRSWNRGQSCHYHHQSHLMPWARSSLQEALGSRSGLEQEMSLTPWFTESLKHYLPFESSPLQGII